jgi:hypothetical protein
MTLFDLLFLALLLAFLCGLLAVMAAAIRGRFTSALAILRALAIGAALYLAVVALTGWLSPPRVLQVGDPWCFDDWCLSVESATHTEAPPGRIYTVSLRLFSRARRVSQRAAGAWIYLVDSSGRRYSPEPESTAIPLDIRLAPGESVVTSRVFKVPASRGPMSLITGHGLPAGFPVPIIGDDSAPFHKSTRVRLP